MNLKKMSAEEVQAAVDQLEANNAAQAVKITELETAHAGCESTIAEQAATIEKLNAVIASASSESKGTPKPGVPTTAVENGGKKYQWLKPSFVLPGDPKKHMAETADEAVIAKVLAIKGQKVLKELV